MKDPIRIIQGEIVIVILFLGSLLAFFILNQFTTLAIDDFAYKFNMSFHLDDDFFRVKNIPDLIDSMAIHYRIMNGRVLANGLAQLFLISDNKVWFNLANTVVFGLFQVFIILVSGERLKKISITYYLFIITLLWFLIPGPNHTLLWLDGSFNYLWVSVLVLAFICLHQRIVLSPNKVSWYWFPLLFISGLIAGAGHEVISVGVAGAYFLYYLFNRQKITGAAVAMVAGFLFGTAFVVFAPGNMVRMESEGLREATILLMIAQRVWSFLLSAKSMASLIILFFVLVFLKLRYKDSLSAVIKGNLILLGAILISLLFILFAGAFQERVFFGVAIFSIIVILSSFRIQKEQFNQKAVRILIGLMTIVMFIEFISVAKTLRENKIDFDQDEKLWLSSEDNVFKFRQKEINRFVCLGLGEHDRFFWQNIVMSKYYGKEYMIFLPEELFDGIYCSDEIINNQNLVMCFSSYTDSIDHAFYSIPGSNFLVMPIRDSINCEFGEGAFVRFIPFAPIGVRDMDIRQRVTNLFYAREPESVNEEKALCYSIRTNHGSYLYLKAPALLPVQSIKTVQIFKNEDKAYCDLQLEVFKCY